jgi:circadian clock protein KaiC
MMREVEDFGPALVFVDSFRSVMQSARPGNEGLTDLQQFIQELGSRMATWQATTFLIGEYSQADVEANPIITVADGMLTLYQATDDNSALRKIRVNKMRGQGHMTGAHTMRIADDGIRVYPRLLPPLADDRLPGAFVDRDPHRISTGVPGLDALMHGGLPEGHTMLVSGPTGAGKTILGTRFLQAGVAEGQKGVAVFFEKGTSRLRNAELAAIVQAGQVRVIESRSLSLSVEELMDQLCTAIDETGATRVVIDSLSELGLYLAPEVRADLRVAVFRTLTTLAKRGVSAMVTVGMEDDYTRLSFSPDELCFLTDAVLSLRFVEFEGALRKFMTVVKVRGCSHSTDVRGYTITAAGIEVGEQTSGLNGVMVGRPTLER